jgi:hypothetical protein
MNVQDLCDGLVANDAALTELEMRLKRVDDADLKLILDAAKKNKTVKKVRVVGDHHSSRGSCLSVPAALSLASAVSKHPEFQEISFCFVTFSKLTRRMFLFCWLTPNFVECIRWLLTGNAIESTTLGNNKRDGKSSFKVIEFGPIALAIQKNRKLTRLRFYFCRVTPNILECIRWLLTENALESMTLLGCTSGNGEPPFNISGALLGNSSLKELVLSDNNFVFGSETFQAIPHMIRAKQDFEIIHLVLSGTTTDRFELVRLIAQAAEGHASLNKLAIEYSFQSDEDIAHHVKTAEAIGTMLRNGAPALRELSLRGTLMGLEGVFHLADEQ